MSRDTHKRLFFNCEQDNKAETSTNSWPTNKLYYNLERVELRLVEDTVGVGAGQRRREVAEQQSHLDLREYYHQDREPCTTTTTTSS